MTTPRLLYITEDSKSTVIKNPSPQWDAIKNWYQNNGLDITNIIDTGGLHIEHGKTEIITIHPLEGHQEHKQTFTSDGPITFHYLIPVTPLPKETFPTNTPREQLAEELAKHFPTNDRFASKTLMIKCQCGDLSLRWHDHIADAIIKAGWTPPKPLTPAEADCWTCAQESSQQNLNSGDNITAYTFRMYLCDTCGSKRCPKARWHENACTNPNN